MKGEFFDRRTAVDVSFFSTTQKNAPYFVFVGAISAQVLIGIDKVDLYGGEFTLTQHLMRGLDAYVGYGYTHSEIKQYLLTPADIGKQAPYVPNQTIDGGLQYRIPITQKLSLFSRLQYQRLGKQYWDPENSTARDPVDLLGARMGVESNDGRWSVIGTINNALNKRYNEEWVGGGFAQLATPRTWIVESTYKF